MYFKQIDEIVDGTKTQTRRVCKPSLCDDDSLLLEGEVAQDIDRQLVISHLGERMSDRVIHSVHTVHNRKSRLKWQVGRDYAVSPGRGLPCALYRSSFVLTYSRDMGGTAKEWTQTHLSAFDGYPAPPDGGWKPLRIRLLEIRREPLQAISVEDAIAEGYPHMEAEHGDYPPRFWYQKLWETINTRKGIRWDDNPDVWVLRFEVVR